MCLKVSASNRCGELAGMLKIVSKFAMDILPSVIATIMGAYIVNHYIVTKPAPAVVAVSPADPRAETRTGAKATEAKADVKESAVGSLPQPGVTAKGISEKAMLEQTAAEKPAVVEKPVVAEKPMEKSADKPAETASLPADTRRHTPAPREKVVAKSVAVPVPPPNPAVAAAPVVAAPAAEAAAGPEEHRDANELARAAIERLRGTGDVSPRPQEATRVTEAPRVIQAAPPAAAPVASTPAIRPLPPPIMVSTPAGDAFNAPTGSTPARAAGIDDPRRPTPPADIPEASPSLSLPIPGPLDLRAEAEPQRREHTNVAEDMLLAAKSVFHAVLPK
jgi:hypothetical protein